MPKKLYIGAATGTFVTKKGKRFMIVKDKPYAFEPRDVKGYESWFLTAEQYVEAIDTKNQFRRIRVETATAAPAEVRKVTPPSVEESVEEPDESSDEAE